MVLKVNKKEINKGILTDIDLRLLRCFVVVAQCRGLSAAEMDLDQDTSAISRQIRDLETWLGYSLCRRGRAGFSLTPEGEQVFDATRELMSATQAFAGRLKGIHDRLFGNINIGVAEKIASNPEARLADALACFKRSAPDVSVVINIGSIATIERGVLDGQLHLGIVPQDSEIKGLNYQPLYTEQLLMYAGTSHPINQFPESELNPEKIYQYQISSISHQPLIKFPELKINRMQAIQGTDQEALALMILSGETLGFLPDHYAQQFVERRRMRPITPDRFHAKNIHSCVFRSDGSYSRSVLAFRAALFNAHDVKPLPH